MKYNATQGKESPSDLESVDPPRCIGRKQHHRLIWYAILHMEKQPFRVSDLYDKVESLGHRVTKSSMGMFLRELWMQGYLRRQRCAQCSLVYEYWLKYRRPEEEEVDP